MVFLWANAGAARGTAVPRAAASLDQVVAAQGDSGHTRCSHIKTRMFIEAAMFQFGAPPPMKMAGVATIDSLLKSIVGFSKGYKCPRLLPGAQ